ncbi:MAG: hypothetical protein CME64_00410 [Halobacteriovoraceae bacterium]|nr:hypothetical protein [Halobacteriovoraceae bacterium]|tara:strand:+ start:102609 stop:103505 length:897 start_codon:yes stop_codon:yes gene_type:complete
MRRGNKEFGQKGFTLLEVMIGLAILSFIMIGVITITDSSQETAIRVTSEDRARLQVETALSRLEWDISQAYSPLYFSHAMEPTGLSEQQGQAYNRLISRYSVNNRFAFPSYEALPVPINNLEEKTTLTLFTSSNRRKFRNTKQSHFAWVRYELVSQEEVARPDEEPLDGEESESLVLIRKFVADDVFNPEEIVWEDVKSQVLLRNVDKLVFELWNPKTRKWTDNIATIKDGRHRIHGVKLTLDWIDTDGIVRQFIRIYRPMFPAGFNAENMYKLQQTSNQGSTTNGQANGASGGGNAQ